MTYEEAKKNFMLFAVFVHKKNRKGKWITEELDLDKESIPDDTEGRVAAFEYGYGFVRGTRLCFIANPQEDE